ncbi:NSUN6 isoform 8 [Pan troglodytes]|uniref:NSUN6 isoform 8 n=1 Tax=Pan troglodytes TaxID=9598 RepID=A0A2J8K604_PANTR|nr:NSUN6 isoform 8 [Pan troglodytes]
MNKEIVTALGKPEAERKFETLLKHLSHPPSFTTVRVNTHLASVQHVKNLLLDELQKQFNGLSVPILQHPDLQDVLLIPVIGPRKNIKKQQCEAIVGAQCGNAVLRGAHVYAPGIVSASKFMKTGDVISVYSDIKGKCKKGAKKFDGTKVFLGNGISELSRKEIFSGLPELKGMGIRMTEPVYLSPSFDSVLPRYLFLQNLPSALVSHVLNPQPGEKILDLCAAPGGKTTHIAALMHDQAVQLLKPEGVLVYSTCTITLAENEEQVAWALTKFPCLQLQPQEPQIGGEGMRGAGLSCEQLKQLQRFDPSAVPLPDTDMDSLREARREDMLRLANKDSIGFFIAKFVKCKST